MLLQWSNLLVTLLINDDKAPKMMFASYISY